MNKHAFVIQTQPKYWRNELGLYIPVYGFRNGGELTTSETFIIEVDPATISVHWHQAMNEDKQSAT